MATEPSRGDPADPRSGALSRVGEVFGKGATDQLIPGDLGETDELLIDIGDHQVWVDGNEGIWRGFDERAVVLLRFVELLTEATLLRDVPGGGEHPSSVALGILEDRRVERDVEQAPLATPQGQLVVGDAPLLQRAAHPVRRLDGVQEIVGERRPNELVAGEPGRSSPSARSRR